MAQTPPCVRTFMDDPYISNNIRHIHSKAMTVIYKSEKFQLFNFEKYRENPVFEKRIAIQHRVFEYCNISRYRNISPALVI